MAGLNNISRLQEEQQKTLKDCELMIEKWEKFQEDYITVESLITELPKKTTHEVMVPIGPLAFMPGHLIHTNEIMVLLGDNWFAERSASQAVEIAKRRLKNVEDYLKNLHEEHKNISSHIAFTSDIANVKSESEFKEIAEELTEKDIRRLERKTRRVAYAKATKDSVKKVDLKNITEGSSSRKSTEDQDLFARLEELERQERINNELDNVSEQETFTEKEELCALGKENESNLGVDHKFSKKVKWKESIAEKREIETAAVPTVKKATIKFSHSSENMPQKKDNNESHDITTPADIFTNYLAQMAFKNDIQHQPRSILKHSNNNDKEENGFSKQTNEDSLKEKPHKIISNSKTEEIKPAFSDVVLEHKDVGNKDVATHQEQKVETRKVSKFKARRMRNNME